MKNFILIIVTMFGFGCNLQKNNQEGSTKIQKLQEDLKAVADSEERDRTLGQYALNMMHQTSAGTKLSNPKKQILARSIVRIANDVFNGQDHKKAFVMLLAIESSFDRMAQSPTGPKGYTQVAKAAFMEGMAACGVKDAKEEDVWETDINLYAGACYFRSLLEKYNNDPYISIVAYNQGPNSPSIKKYSKNGRLDEIEPLKYVAKFAFLDRSVTEQQMPNVPAINSLSIKPQSSNISSED